MYLDGRIPKAYNYTLNNERWRFGVILSFEESMALVKCESIEKKISISISGPEKKRKILLNIIMNDFDTLHKSYANLKVEKLIPLQMNLNINISYQELLIMDKKGIGKFPKVVDDEIIEINVKDLLNSINIEEKIKKPLNLLIISSHEDKLYENELRKHLISLTRNDSINVLDNLQPKPVKNWSNRTNEHLNNSDLILILLSPNLLASDYFFNSELKIINELSISGRAKLMPIILTHSLWQNLPLSNIKVLPSSGQPISALKNRDIGWTSVIREIEKYIEEYWGDKSNDEKLFISKIYIENIRSIEKIQINCQNPKPNTLNMFSLILGENGVGKTTILRSIAIGLASENEATGFLNQISGEFLRTGVNSGKIIIDLYSSISNQAYAIETTLLRNNSGDIKVAKNFSSNFPKEKLFVCGYGAGRSGFGTDDVENYSIRESTQTLFNYEANLQNPELSFRRIQSEGISLDDIARKIDEILMIEMGSTIIGKNGIQIIGPWGDFVPIGGLGDGYKATLAWISDLIGWSFLYSRDALKNDISGIVLIDELEQHLHPRWQRVIIKRLKQQFPKIQFFVTTHTPLLAIGASDFEDSLIICLEREDETDIIKSRIIPNDLIEGKTINTVLLEAFGLYSSLSPRSISEIELYTVLSSKSKLLNNEKEELERLTRKFGFDNNEPDIDVLKKNINKYL